MRDLSQKLFAVAGFRAISTTAAAKANAKPTATAAATFGPKNCGRF